MPGDAGGKIVSMGYDGEIIASVIIPCRNEERFIINCLDSIIDNDYPKGNMEVLVVDGMSEDNTRSIVQRYAEKHKFIRLYDNHRRIVPTGMNIGIRHARGEIIIRMDAHNTYDKSYISKCIKYLKEYQADNVGGIWVTRPGADTVTAKSIALALSHPFGVGNAHFRIGLKEPKEVDTVPFGCYRRSIFDQIGFFNEYLTRNQDIEFNLRLKKNGGKILLMPDIVSEYYARATLKALAKNNFWNGFWVVHGGQFADLPFSVRHLIPLVFVLSLAGSLLVASFYKLFFLFFALIFGMYMLLNILFSFRLGYGHGARQFLLLIATFSTLHFSYGIGSLWGICRFIAKR